MVAANYAQGWTPAGLGKPVTRHGMPAPVAAHDQFQCPTRSEKPRVHCRGRSTPRTFYPRTAGGRCIGNQRRRADAILLPASVRRNFTPRAVTLDEIHELRICELTGRQAVLSRAQALTDHREAVPAVPRQVDQFSNPSRVSVFDDQDHSERHLEPCSLFRGSRYPR